jgi:hypothetical protein
MHITTRPTDKEPHSYRLNRTDVAHTQLEKDIAVLIDPWLSFESRMHAKVNRANSILGVILQTIQYKDATSLLALYKALVRPHLEYCNQVWSLYLIKDITTIEAVQSWLTRSVPGMKDLEYEERLRCLKLLTLSY